MNKQNDWIGCGECDCVFDCYDGKAKCIRLPYKPPTTLESKLHRLAAAIQLHIDGHYNIDFKETLNLVNECRIIAEKERIGG